MLSYKAIKAGQCAAVWDRNGRVQIVTGPRRLLTLGRTIEPLACHSAGPSQYLVARHRDGRVQHIPGPAALWQHPLDHASIETRSAIVLDANEAIIVYSQEPDRVGRRIVRGPALFVPAANEWLHEFSWHGADPKDPLNRKVPHALRFTRLRVIPDQTYFAVQDVRTADDALLIVRLMIFFELVDVQTMLDQTHDPIADFINAVSADVIDFVAARSFDRFKDQTELLNELATYPQLTQRATRIGYRINKVVYRGYQANTKLQTMHDGAIEARTRLRLEAERQAQELADLKLQREAERGERRQAMERDEQEHRNALARLTHDEDLRRRAADQEAKLAALRRRRELQLEHEQSRHRERIVYLQAMNGLQVDLTRYLVARYQHPDRLIRIDGGARAGNGTQLHLHERMRRT